MARGDQPDLFGGDEPELPGADGKPVVYRADPARVRAELLQVLATARAAKAIRGSRAAFSIGASFSRR